MTKRLKEHSQLVIIFLLLLICVGLYVDRLYNRRMLNRRGRNQQILIKACIRLGNCTPEEAKDIIAGWSEAEYNLAGVEPPEIKD